jgi:hypothetical protein
MTKTNELNALLKKMIGKPMTKEQREELERLKEQVKRDVCAAEKSCYFGGFASIIKHRHLLEKTH